MKLRFALVGLIALTGATLSGETASAMPLFPYGQSQTSNVENAAVVCGARGCVRTVPRYGYGVRRYGYGVRRGYAYHRGYRRW
jgi:hypothetical protein